MSNRLAQSDHTFIGLIKDGERYAFSFQPHTHNRIQQAIGQLAADKEVNLTWYDAAVLSQKIRKLLEEKTSDAVEPRTGIRVMKYADKSALAFAERRTLLYETDLDPETVRAHMSYIFNNCDESSEQEDPY